MNLVFICSVFYVFFDIIIAFQDDEDSTAGKKRQVNFASISAGAVVLESSPKANGYHYLLNDDKDKYGISPCSEKKWLVIGLSEDIVVEEIVIANYEKFSSSLETFQILSSTSFPTTDWNDLGSFVATAELGEQVFHLEKPSWGRYLKFRFLTHHGDEFYCTLTQIKVHGSTVLENLKKEVERSTREVLDLESAILEDQENRSISEEDMESNFSDGCNATMAFDASIHGENGGACENQLACDIQGNYPEDDLSLSQSPPSLDPYPQSNIPFHSPGLKESMVEDKVEVIESIFFNFSNSTPTEKNSEVVINSTVKADPESLEVLIEETVQHSQNISVENMDTTLPLNLSNPITSENISLECIAENETRIAQNLVDTKDDESESHPQSESRLGMDHVTSTSQSSHTVNEDHLSVNNTLAADGVFADSNSNESSTESNINETLPFSTTSFSKLKSCIDQLKFPEFQAKMKAKLVAGSQLLSQSNTPSAAELNQDVFRSLMKKISSLEQNSKIVEFYLLQISECQVLLTKELETLLHNAAKMENVTSRELDVKQTLEFLNVFLKDLPSSESNLEAPELSTFSDEAPRLSFSEIVRGCLLLPLNSSLMKPRNEDCLYLATGFSFLSLVMSFLTCLLVLISLCCRKQRTLS